MTYIYILLTLAVGGIGYMLWNQRAKPQDQTNNKEIETLKAQLRDAETKRDEFSGKNKQLFAAQTKLEAERDTLSKTVAKFEAQNAQKEKDFDRHMEDLNNAKKSLEDERARVRNEDETRRREEEEKRDRIWNDHEQNVIALLRELCKKPDCHFTSYDNKELPTGFDGSLKPDFLIEFLDQYVIFDAKASKAKSLQTYINDAVKKTAEKIKDNSMIAKFVFLVVPTNAIGELKAHQYMQDGYTFYVVPPEALGPVLASLKRITMYALADKFDPKDRENIVNLIVKFDGYINFRNALDVLLAQQGVQSLNDISQLSSDLIKDIEDRKEKYAPPSINKAEVKRLMNSGARAEEIEDLVNPRAKVLQQSVDSVKEKLLK